MTPREKLKSTLDNNQKEYEKLPNWAKNSFFPKNLFPQPEKLANISPKPIDSKIKEHYIDLDPVEWESVTKVYFGILNTGIAATIIRPKIENDKIKIEVKIPNSKTKSEKLTKNNYDDEMFENTKR